MKYVLDSSVAAKWYLGDADTPKALRLRFDFYRGLHELLAPDIFPVECGDILERAERAGEINLGDTDNYLDDLFVVAVPLHFSWPLLRRAAAIALATRLNIYDSLYVALAERENCELLTADQKVMRKVLKQFPFVIDFASLP